MKRFTLTLTIVLLLSGTVFAGFSGFSDGRFVKPVISDPIQWRYLSGLGTNQITTGKGVPWVGSPTTLEFHNHFSFDDVELCQPFRFGKLTFHNGLTMLNTQIEGISLQTRMTITDPVHYTGYSEMDLSFDFRPFCDGLIMDDENLTFDMGDDYYLQILGFDPCGDLSWYVPEGCTQSRFIWAQVCRQPIPAPGAVLLGGIGIGIVGWLRRRKNA